MDNVNDGRVVVVMVAKAVNASWFTSASQC